MSTKVENTPKKPAIDINKLKAKLAADKAKLEKIKHETKKMEVEETPPSEKKEVNVLYDPRMPRDRVTRKKRPLVFIEPESKPEEILKKRKKDDIPDVEWWDAPYLEKSDYDSKILTDKITNKIEHPLLTIAQEKPSRPQPLMLTPAEQRRLRKKNRQAEQERRRNEILLGQVEPPSGRIKISNMMKVLGGEAIQDPTQLEKKVLEEMRIREARHHARNQARKLTPEQRAEKKRKKYLEDTSHMSRVAIFKTKHMKNPKHRFKIDMNAKQYSLSGCVLNGKDFSVVIVEGGPKAIKKYKHLLLKRIDWGETELPSKTSSITMTFPPNECHLVWEGEVLKPAFVDFRFESHEEPRKFLESLGIAHYWDYAKSFRPNVETEIL